MSEDVTVTLNDSAVAALLNSPDGPIGIDLLKRGIRVETDVKRRLKQTGKGRVYEKYKPRRTHRASAPGDAPATDLGHLGASYGRALGHDGRGLFVQVGTGLKVGLFLEIGTRTIDPRPALRPALAKAAD